MDLMIILIVVVVVVLCGSFIVSYMDSQLAEIPHPALVQAGGYALGTSTVRMSDGRVVECVSILARPDTLQCDFSRNAK